MKLSIIIPVYNVEKYVGATLQSILDQRQDVLDYEVIIVDDGTADNSMQVVESYINKLPLTVIHQENKGLSGARNAGFRKAKGDYVWFVDSDDTLPPKSFELVYKMLYKNDAEIFTFGLFSVREGMDSLQPMQTIFTKTPEKYIGHIFSGKQLHGIIGTGLAQKNIFERTFLDKYNLSFLEGLYHEDMEFLARAFFFAKRIYVTDTPLYIYLLRNSGSIMATRNERHLASEIKIIESFVKFRNQFAKSSFEKSLINDRICSMALKLLSLDDSLVKGYSTYMASRKREVRWIGIKAAISSLNIMTKGKMLRINLLVFAPYLLPRIRKELN